MIVERNEILDNMIYRRSVSRKTRLEVYERDKGICQLCGNPVGAEYDIDHLKPIWSGGSNRAENLQLSCRACHKIKTAEEAPQRARVAGFNKDHQRALRGLGPKPPKRSRWAKRKLKSRNTLRRER